MDPTQGALRNPTAAPTPVTPTSQTHDPGQGGSAHSCATRRRSGARRWGKELMATQVYGTVRWPHVTDSYGAIHRKDTEQDAATENDSRKCRLCRGTCGHPPWNSNPPEQGEEMAWLTAQNRGGPVRQTPYRWMAGERRREMTETRPQVSSRLNAGSRLNCRCKRTENLRRRGRSGENPATKSSAPSSRGRVRSADHLNHRPVLSS